MGLFSFFMGGDINEGVKEYTALSRAMLIDVREKEEYRSGHIPDAKNIPLSQIEKTPSIVTDKSMPLFVYCLSGARSGQAVGRLKRMGYTSVKNIGGIGSYRGKITS